MGLGPPELKQATETHLELYLKTLALLPLGAASMPPSHEEKAAHTPRGAQDGAGPREALAPRTMTFLASGQDDKIAWLPLETALALVQTRFRSHPTFSLTPVTLLLQRHAAANLRRATPVCMGVRANVCECVCLCLCLCQRVCVRVCVRVNLRVGMEVGRQRREAGCRIYKQIL